MSKSPQHQSQQSSPTATACNLLTLPHSTYHPSHLALATPTSSANLLLDPLHPLVNSATMAALQPSQPKMSPSTTKTASFSAVSATPPLGFGNSTPIIHQPSSTIYSTSRQPPSMLPTPLLQIPPSPIALPFSMQHVDHHPSQLGSSPSTKAFSLHGPNSLPNEYVSFLHTLPP